MEEDLGNINEQLEEKDDKINELESTLKTEKDCCDSKSSELIKARKTIAEYENQLENLGEIDVP